jgi:membrane-associated phospholipid phosphatase
MSYLTRNWPIRAGGAGWLLAAAICALALAALAQLDAELSVFGRSLPEPLIVVFAWITRLGESDWILLPSLAVLVVAAIAVPLARAYAARRALRQLGLVAGFIFCGVGLPGLITLLVKRLVGRGRPELLDMVGAFDFRSFGWADWVYQSFPSGHATTGFALCFTTAFVVPRSFPVMLAVAVLIGLSRIVVGAHYPTDVLAGAVIGVLGAYLVRNIFASRRWVFEYAPDGTVVMRPLAAIRRYLTRRRGSARRRP